MTLGTILLGKKVRSPSPSGREYHQETIDFMLEARETKAKLRRSGGLTRGPTKRTDEDDNSFSKQLEQIIQEEKLD